MALPAGRGNRAAGSPGLIESDTPLLEQAVAGDREALTTLLEAVGVGLHAEVAAGINPAYRSFFDADDILQVTFLEAFLRIRDFVPSGLASFRAWLRRIAENNVRDAVKELERDKRPPPGRRAQVAPGDVSYVALIERLAVTTTTASRPLVQSELQAGVDAALRRLPPDYEMALRLYELKGLSGEEVAEKMNRSHGAVRMLLARARESLADALKGDPLFYSRA